MAMVPVRVPDTFSLLRSAITSTRPDRVYAAMLFVFPEMSRSCKAWPWRNIPPAKTFMDSAESLQPDKAKAGMRVPCHFSILAVYLVST